MSKLKTNTIRHVDGSNDNITLDSSQNVTVEGVLKTDSLRHTGASTDGTCTAKITNNLSNRNLIINGDMQVAQRGTSTAYSNNGNGYVLDRWYSANTSSGTLTVSQQTTTLGDVDSVNYLRAVTASTVGNSATVYSEHKVENIKRFHNKAVTLSFMVKGSAALTFQLRRHYNYGTGGSSEEYSGFTNVSVTTGWTKITQTFSAVDFSSKTIGPNNTSYFGIMFYWSTNQGTDQRNDATIEVTNVQLEEGDVATDFEHRSYGDELARCQRYYYMHADTITTNIGAGCYYSSTLFAFSVQFPTTMRAAPSLDYVSGGSYYVVYANGTTDQLDSMGIIRQTPRSAAVDTSTGTSGTAGHGGIIGTNASEAHIAFSAEL